MVRTVYENFTITILERPDPKRHGYKYIINAWNSALGYVAFKTEKGYQEWLKRSNLNVRHNEDRLTDDRGLVRFFSARGTIEERLFWSLSEVPEGAICYKDYSNGDIVDCYYIQIESGSILYKPNPNAKDVYKPLTLEELIEYNKING